MLITERGFMMRKFKKRWLLILVFISILSASSFNRHYKEVGAQEEDTTEVVPYKKPSGDATKFLGIWLTSGFNLQPASETYLEVGQTKTISGNAGRSMVMYALTIGYTSKKYQWYKSTDGKTWSKDTSSSAKKKTLSITPSEVGKTYYQLEVYWQMPIINTKASYLYSNVATVNAVPEPVNATGVEVTAADDYLYNSSNDLVNTETTAHAHPDPANFTGTVSWSVDNENLATIDKETGEIEANTSRLSGVVRVTATLHNPNGSTISNFKDITIGGGLEDQTVNAGKTATFDLRGNIGDLDDNDDDGENNNNYTVKWYKEDPITHTREQIQKDDPQALSYTTPKTTLDDDGTLFLAIIQIKYAGKTYSYTTNDAFLHVKPEGGPNISITNTMENSTFNDGTNTDNMLFGVNNGDQVVYHDTLKNNTTGGRLNDATYTLPLKNGTTVKSVKIDGAETDNYKLSSNSTTNATDLVISGLAFNINESHTIDVETEVAGIDKKDSFDSIPYITGKDDDGIAYQKIGNQNIINYTLDTVAIKNANDIDYGTLNSVMSEGTLNRPDELNLPNNLVDIEDTRRNKKSVVLNVEQVGEFKNQSSSEVLSGHLRFYNGKTYYDLLNNPVSVYQTENDEPLNSQGWGRDEGILLYMDSKVNTAGTYSTTLNWEIKDSV